MFYITLHLERHIHLVSISYVIKNNPFSYGTVLRSSTEDILHQVSFVPGSLTPATSIHSCCGPLTQGVDTRAPLARSGKQAASGTCKRLCRIQHIGRGWSKIQRDLRTRCGRVTELMQPPWARGGCISSTLSATTFQVFQLQLASRPL